LGLQDLAEGGIVAIAVDGARAVELRVVEGVEGFEAEFKSSEEAAEDLIGIVRSYLK